MSQTRPARSSDQLTPKERLIKLLVEKSFHSSEEPQFPLASGVQSRYYIDCKLALSYPHFREFVGELIMERVSDMAINGVGGLALGAYPIGVAVSDAFYRTRREIVRAFVARKEPKPHGLKKHIEGDVAEGDRVLIVDDVITSGKSTVEAITKARDEGLIVVKAIAVIDREELDGSDTIRRCGVPFEALLTLRDLIEFQSNERHP